MKKPLPSFVWGSLKPRALGAMPTSPRVDPRLIWGDATNWRDFGGEHFIGTRIPVLVEINRAQTRRFGNDVRANGGFVPRIYDDLSLPFRTAEVTHEHLRRLIVGTGSGSPVVRVSQQLSVIPQRPRPALPAAGPSEEAAVRPRSTSRTLIAVIDVGCPFAHVGLRSAGGDGTRVVSYWIQDGWFGPGAAARGAPPRSFGYGLQLDRQALNAAMRARSSQGRIDEAAVYADLGLDVLAQRISHGGAVLDLVAGARSLDERVSEIPGDDPKWTLSNDEASRSDIVFVQLPRDVIQDTGGAGAERFLLDGLLYAMSCAGPRTKNIVATIGYGSQRGTHDGRSMIERAVRWLVDFHDGRLKRKKLAVVVPAGNGFGERCHAQVDELKANEWFDLRLRLPVSNETPSQVVVRVPGSLVKHLEIRVRPPGAESMHDGSDVARTGQSKGLFDRGQVQCGVVFPAAREAEAVEALICFAPTETANGDAACSTAGDWRISFRTPRGSREAIHLYALKNQQVLGAIRRGQQPRFIDGAYDQERFLRAEEDDPARPRSAIRRRGSLNSLVTSRKHPRIIVVGSSYLNGSLGRQRVPTWYSADGPAVATSISAPVRKGVDRYAATEISRGIGGIVAGGNLSGSRVRVRGTSFAAPQVARELVNRRKSLPKAIAEPSALGPRTRPP